MVLAVGAVGPLAIVVIYSFLTPGDYAGVKWIFSGEAWLNLFLQQDIFDDTWQWADAHLSIFARTLGLAIGTTLATLVLGSPTAWFIATRPKRSRSFWLFLVTIPFWCNLLVRTFAIMQLIRNEGVINSILRGLRLIDTASGDLLGRVKQLPGAPIQISFAPDGSRFAMAYGPRGVEFRSAQGKRLYQDLTRPVAALAISDDLLVTISDEAEVRVLDVREPDQVPLRTWRLKDAGQPFSMALAPDGKRLAIGYGDRPFVDVVELTGKGKVRLAPPKAKHTTGNLAFVAWTQGDEPTLVAGGTVQTLGRQNVLVAWRDGRAGTPATLAVSADAVTALVPAGTDGVAYATADPPGAMSTWPRTAVWSASAAGPASGSTFAS